MNGSRIADGFWQWSAEHLAENNGRFTASASSGSLQKHAPTLRRVMAVPQPIREAMTRNIAFLLLSVIMITPTQRIEGRNRLTVLSTEQKKDDYYLILRRVFHRLYASDVVVAELFAVGSGDEESAGGVLKTAKGFTAFALFSSPSVWKTELPRLMRGTKEICVDDDGKEIQCPPETRPKTEPRSYHDIKVIMKTRPLTGDLAARIERVWQQRVREALRLPALTDGERGFAGGFEHYYSVRSTGHDWSTALGQTGGENTETEQMARLASSLKGYAGGTDSEDALRAALMPLEERKK